MEVVGLIEKTSSSSELRVPRRSLRAMGAAAYVWGVIFGLGAASVVAYEVTKRVALPPFLVISLWVVLQAAGLYASVHYAQRLAVGLGWRPLCWFEFEDDRTIVKAPRSFRARSTEIPVGSDIRVEVGTRVFPVRWGLYRGEATHLSATVFADGRKVTATGVMGVRRGMDWQTWCADMEAGAPGIEVTYIGPIGDRG